MKYYIGYNINDKIKPILTTKKDSLEEIVNYTLNQDLEELKYYLFTNGQIPNKDIRLVYTVRKKDGYKEVSNIYTKESIDNIDINYLIEVLETLFTDEENIEHIYIERMKINGYMESIINYFKNLYNKFLFTDYITPYKDSLYESKLKELIKEYLENIDTYNSKTSRTKFYGILNELCYHDSKNLIKLFENEFVYIKGINIPKEFEILKSIYNSKNSNSDEISNFVLKAIEYDEEKESIDISKYFILLVMINNLILRINEKLNQMAYEAKIDGLSGEKTKKLEANLLYDEYLEESDFARINSSLNENREKINR